MKSRTRSIIGWTAAAPVIAFNVFAAVMKFKPIVPGSLEEEFAKGLGTIGLERGLGVLEFIILVLFVIPRTSTVGFVLMIGYMGGALATNLTHGYTHMDAMPIYVIFVLLMISAWFRNPELTERMLGKRK